MGGGRLPQRIMFAETFRVSDGGGGVGADKVDRLCTERRPDVWHCVGLETVGVGGRGVVGDGH